MNPDILSISFIVMLHLCFQIEENKHKKKETDKPRFRSTWDGGSLIKQDQDRRRSSVAAIPEYMKTGKKPPVADADDKSIDGDVGEPSTEMSGPEQHHVGEGDLSDIIEYADEVGPSESATEMPGPEQHHVGEGDSSDIMEHHADEGSPGEPAAEMPGPEHHHDGEGDTKGIIEHADEVGTSEPAEILDPDQQPKVEEDNMDTERNTGDPEAASSGETGETAFPVPYTDNDSLRVPQPPAPSQPGDINFDINEFMANEEAKEQLENEQLPDYFLPDDDINGVITTGEDAPEGESPENVSVTNADPELSPEGSPPEPSTSYDIPRPGVRVSPEESPVEKREPVLPEGSLKRARHSISHVSRAALSDRSRKIIKK
jgi:hypothetical protein